MISVAFHLFGVCMYIFLGHYYMEMNIPTDWKIGMPNIRENWWQFLTIWNTGFQGVYFFMCVAEDALKITPRNILVGAKDNIERARDVMFQTLVLPLSLAVTAVFWTIFTYDRQVIFPEEIDVVVPSWLNHCLHTNIVLFAFGELLICRRPFENHWSRYAFGFLIMMLYNATLVFSYYWQGFWTYPMFGKMTETQRFLFYCCMYLTYTTTYTLGCKINAIVCGPRGRNEMINQHHRKRS